MDVLRSFPNKEGFDPEVLTRVLRSIAFSYSDSASYCQGMNYLAGIFQIEYVQEDTSFRMMSQLLEKRMMKVFTSEFQHLQMNFYILDRLIELFIPDLHRHFSEENIVPVFYSSGWFITLFTNTLQYTVRSYMVLWVMDFFIAESTKGFFKCIIVLLRYLKPRFMKMSFDQIMNFLSDITRKEMFTNIEYCKYLEDKKQDLPLQELSNKYAGYIQDFSFLDSYKARVAAVSLSDSLLLHLEKKYLKVSNNLKNKL